MKSTHIAAPLIVCAALLSGCGDSQVNNAQVVEPEYDTLCCGPVMEPDKERDENTRPDDAINTGNAIAHQENGSSSSGGCG